MGCVGLCPFANKISITRPPWRTHNPNNPSPPTKPTQERHPPPRGHDPLERAHALPGVLQPFHQAGDRLGQAQLPPLVEEHRGGVVPRGAVALHLFVLWGGVEFFWSRDNKQWT